MKIHDLFIIVRFRKIVADIESDVRINTTT